MLALEDEETVFCSCAGQHKAAVIGARNICCVYLGRVFPSGCEVCSKKYAKICGFLIMGKSWELKSPTGVGKHNVQHALQRASKQSKNIVFDARYSRMHTNRLKFELRSQTRLIHSIKRLLLIEKSGKVIEIV